MAVPCIHAGRPFLQPAPGSLHSASVSRSTASSMEIRSWRFGAAATDGRRTPTRLPCRHTGCGCRFPMNRKQKNGPSADSPREFQCGESLRFGPVFRRLYPGAPIYTAVCPGVSVRSKPVGPGNRPCNRLAVSITVLAVIPVNWRSVTTAPLASWVSVETPSTSSAS
jgi:hypothetical protein